MIVLDDDDDQGDSDEEMEMEEVLSESRRAVAPAEQHDVSMEGDEEDEEQLAKVGHLLMWFQLDADVSR